MRDAPTVFAVLSFGANIVLALVVYSFKATIRVAILEAIAAIKDTITTDYARKEDLDAVEDRLREQIGLRDEIRAGFGRMGVNIRDKT